MGRIDHAKVRDTMHHPMIDQIKTADEQAERGVVLHDAEWLAKLPA